MKVYRIRNDELYHHGIKGQKWGVRRYQNADGTLTDVGRKRYVKYGVTDEHYTLNVRQYSRMHDALEKSTDKAYDRVTKFAAPAAIVSMGIGAALGIPVAGPVAAGIISVGSVAAAVAKEKINKKKIKDAVDNMTPQQRTFVEQFNKEYDEYRKNNTLAAIAKSKGDTKTFEEYTKKANNNQVKASLIADASEKVSRSKKLTELAYNSKDHKLNGTVDMKKKSYVTKQKKEPETKYTIEDMRRIYVDNIKKARRNSDGTITVTPEYAKLNDYMEDLRLSGNREEYKKMKNMAMKMAQQEVHNVPKYLKEAGYL